MRVKTGQTVRLYGFRGTFTVLPGTSRYHDFFASRVDDGYCHGFSAHDSSIVEIDGQPVPMLSAPIAPPADDYPHKPIFEYSDGPQSLGESALRMWQQRQGK